MKRRNFLCTSLGLSGVAGLTLLAPAAYAIGMPDSAQELIWQERALTGFGTTLTLKAGATNPAMLGRALDSSVMMIRSIESAMNLFDPGSALSRLNRNGELPDAPDHLMSVMDMALMVARRSNGAFDPSVQPLWLAYAAAKRLGRLPDAQELAAARSRICWQAISVSGKHIRLQKPGMGLTLNGVAQGYASEQVRQVMLEHGIRHALINAGEWAQLGNKGTTAQAWQIAVEDPRNGQLARLIRGDGRAIATSSYAVEYFSPDHRHHHIFDPHTGDSPPALASVTVLAPSATLADALTKVFFVAGPEKIPALARQWQADVLWMDRSGNWGHTAGLQQRVTILG